MTFFRLVLTNRTCCPVPRFESSENTTEAIATHLLPLACAALELAPGSLTPSTDLADLVPEKLREKQYLRVVYAVKLAFGVEFTWRVAEHTGSVEKLADKIREGREVLRHAGAGAGSNVANAGTDKDD